MNQKEKDKMTLETITAYRDTVDVFMKSALYWMDRCLKAERFIELTPCDPDIHDDQYDAYHEWQEAISDRPCND